MAPGPPTHHVVPTPIERHGGCKTVHCAAVFQPQRPHADRPGDDTLQPWRNGKLEEANKKKWKSKK
jgi:hypothetical protein